MQELVTPPALARKLGICEATIYRWIRDRRIPAPDVVVGPARAYSTDLVQEISERHQARRTTPLADERTR